MQTALKLGSVTNFDMLFLVMGFISLIDEIQFMLISSCHIYIRCTTNKKCLRHGSYSTYNNTYNNTSCFSFATSPLTRS